MSAPDNPDDASAASAADLIDFTTLKSLEQLTPEASFIERLVAGYVQDTEEQLRVVTDAVAAGDLPGLRDALHAVGGSSGNIGAVRMMRWCAAMRAQSDSQLLGEGKGLVDRLATLIQESRAMLLRYLGDRTLPKP
jgi:HPt (histidine-containing phosphotransfer) domain-containing protein